MAHRAGRPLEKVPESDLTKRKFLKFKVDGNCNNAFVDFCKEHGIDGQEWFHRKLHADGICKEETAA